MSSMLATAISTVTCLGVSARVVDLSWDLNDATIFWPGGREGFSLCMQCVEGSSPSDFYAAGTLSVAEHGGTHVDAPYHFAKNGRRVDELRMFELIGPAYVVDVSARSAPGVPGAAAYMLTVDDLLAFEAAHQLTLPAGAIVLVRTGWAVNYTCGAKAYLGKGRGIRERANLHTPLISIVPLVAIARVRRGDGGTVRHENVRTGVPRYLESGSGAACG